MKAEGFCLPKFLIQVIVLLLKEDRTSLKHFFFSFQKPRRDTHEKGKIEMIGIFLVLFCFICRNQKAWGKLWQDAEKNQFKRFSGSEERRGGGLVLVTLPSQTYKAETKAKMIYCFLLDKSRYIAFFFFFFL